MLVLLKEGKQQYKSLKACLLFDADGDATVKAKKAKKVQTEQPMIIIICTPLMSRVHQHIRQASEMVFCDSTSSLDHFNISFLFSQLLILLVGFL